MKTLRIILVDRHEINRKKLHAQISSLNHYNYELYEADTVENTSALIKNNKIDLIILGINNIGVEEINKLASFNNKFPTISFIIKSKDYSQQNIDKLFDVGVSGFLAKESLSNELIFEAIQYAFNVNEIKKFSINAKNFFHSTVNSLSASIAILDESGTILYVNKAWQKFAFENNLRNQNQIIGLNYINTVFYLDDEDVIGKKVAEGIKDIAEYRKDKFYIEYSSISSSVKLWYSLSVTFFEQNDERKIVVSHENITQRREMEESQKISDRIFNNSIDMLCIAGYDGYFKTLNPSWTRTLGWSIEEMLSKPWIEFVHPEDVEATENIKSVVIDGTKIFQFENRYVCKDGGIKWLSWNTFPYSEENVMFGVARDVSEKKERESKLNILSQAIEQSPVSIVVTNLDGNIEYVNPKFSEATGYDKEDVLGHNPRVLKSGNKTTEDYKILWDTICSGKEWQGEFNNKRKDGSTFWENAKISPIYNNDKITHFVAVKEDITKRKEYEDELIKSKKEAEKSDKLKSEFLTQISHEIRTPVNTLLSFASLIKNDLGGQISEDLVSSFEFMDKAGTRLIRTIDLLVKISELHTNNYEPEYLENDLIEILEEILPEHKVNAAEKNIDLLFIKKTDITKVNIDKLTIIDVFNNLIDNAIKFTEKGTVKIIVEKTIRNKISISVQDSGVGISEQYIANIFSPFSQESGGYSRKFDGNGLGLTLVKKYCDLNQVEIIVHSQKNKGSNFTLFFK